MYKLAPYLRRIQAPVTISSHVAQNRVIQGPGGKPDPEGKRHDYDSRTLTLNGLNHDGDDRAEPRAAIEERAPSPFAAADAAHDAKEAIEEIRAGLAEIGGESADMALEALCGGNAAEIAARHGVSELHVRQAARAAARKLVSHGGFRTREA